MSPVVIFLIVLIIGIVAGLIFDRSAGPSWFTRQITGAKQSMVTSGFVGVAGSFIGYHLAMLIGFGDGAALVGAIVGAVAILFGWRSAR